MGDFSLHFYLFSVLHWIWNPTTAGPRKMKFNSHYLRCYTTLTMFLLDLWWQVDRISHAHTTRLKCVWTKCYQPTTGYMFSTWKRFCSVKSIIFLSFGRKELRGTIAVANNSLQSGKKMLIGREQSRQQLHSIPRYSRTLYCFIVLIIGTNYRATQMDSDLLESLHYDFLWWGLSNKCEESEQWRRRNKKVTQWDPIGGVG